MNKQDKNQPDITKALKIDQKLDEILLNENKDEAVEKVSKVIASSSNQHGTNR